MGAFVGWFVHGQWILVYFCKQYASQIQSGSLTKAKAILVTLPHAKRLAVACPVIWNLRTHPVFIRRCVSAGLVLVALPGGYGFVERVWPGKKRGARLAGRRGGSEQKLVPLPGRDRR